MAGITDGRLGMLVYSEPSGIVQPAMLIGAHVVLGWVNIGFRAISHALLHHPNGPAPVVVWCPFVFYVKQDAIFGEVALCYKECTD